MRLNNAKRIIHINQITHEYFMDVVDDRVLALVIPNFIPTSECEYLSNRILKSEFLAPYTHELIENGHLVQKYFGVDRLGVPFNLTYSDDPAAKDYYYENVSRFSNAIKSIVATTLSPIDRLKSELAAKLNFKIESASFEGRTMLTGIVRIARAELSHLGAEEPHYDALPEEYATLSAQLAANIYLQAPDKGGELEIWDIPPVKPGYEPPVNWRSSLPNSVVITPRIGDLIIFNCRKPHAVGAFQGQPRISMQMFMGYKENTPLQLWN